MRAEAAASVLAKKTKAMQAQVPLYIYIYKRQLYRPFHLQSGRFIEIPNKVAVLTERSEKLEVRRAREAEGYQVCTYLRQEKEIEI